MFPTGEYYEAIVSNGKNKAGILLEQIQVKEYIFTLKNKKNVHFENIYSCILPIKILKIYLII